MTLFKSMWRSVVLAGIAGVLMFAGGAWADAALTLSPNTAQTFPDEAEGYTTRPTAITITVTNTGDAAFTALDAALSGTDAASFDLVKTGLPVDLAIASGGSPTGAVTVQPKAGLTEGTYSTTLTISQSAISATIDFDFEVTAPAAFEPVTNIAGVPAYGVTGGNVTLTGTVEPANATNQTIVWTLASSGSTATGAAVNAGVATATGDGTVKVTATITNGLTVSSNYTQDFTITFAAYEPVTAINNVPTTGTVGTDLTLTGTVAPANASYQTIVWSLGTGSTAAGAAVSGGKARATGSGTVVVTATITNGLTASTPFTRDFTITFSTGSVAAPTITISRQPTATGDGTPALVGGKIIQYVGNITARLNVAATIAGQPATFSPDTGFRYTWFRTTATDEADIKYSGANQNTNMVKSTMTSAATGNFFQLPEGLTSLNATTPQDYKYFVVVSAPSLDKPGAVVSKVSAFVTVTVNPRPVLTVSTQPTSVTGVSLKEGAISGVDLTFTVAGPNPAVQVGGVTAAEAYQWYWVSNANGSGGGIIDGTAEASAITGTYSIPTTLKAGVYYFRCEANYMLGTVPLAIPVKSNVVRVEVNPTVASTKTLIPATATINIADVTTLTYDVPALASSSTGTKMMVALPTTNIVSGLTLATGQAATWDIDSIIYKKILTTSGSAYAGGNHSIGYPNAAITATPTPGIVGLGNQKKNHGVLYAGTYEVSVRVRGEVKTGATVNATYEGWKKVLLTVNPKNLSALTAQGFSVKGPDKDTVYDGRQKTPLVTLKDVNELVAGTDYKVNLPSVKELWINAGVATVKISGCADLKDNTGVAGTSGTDERCTGHPATGSDANYIGDREGTFTIRRLPLAINQTATVVNGKSYDGSDSLAAASIIVQFTPSTTPDVLRPGVDYIISGAKFDNKDVGTRTVNSISVRLDETNSPLAKNYTFGAVNAAAVLSTSFSKQGVVITKKDINSDPDAKAFLSYTIPTTHRYNGQARGIGTVAWKGNVTNPGQAAFEVNYAKMKVGVADDGTGGTDVNETPSPALPKGDEGESTTDPTTGVVTWTEKPGSRSVVYAISVNVKGGSNFNDGTIYFAAPTTTVKETYTIKSRAQLSSIVTKPRRKDVAVTGFINGATEDTTVYVGMSLSLNVKPERPDSVVLTLKDKDGRDSTGYFKYKGGSFSYQWYKVPTADAVTYGGTTPQPAGSATKWDTLSTASAKTDTYSLPLPLKTNATGDAHEYYQVRVIWSYPSVTVPDTQFLTVTGANSALRVKIGPEPVSLTDATVTVTGAFPYTGVIYNRVGDADVTLNQGASSVTVTVPGVASALSATDDYTLTSYGLNAGTGAGTVTVVGKNAYKGTVIGYFDIDQITTDNTYLTFGTTKQYNDSIQEFSVTPRAPYSGLGKVDRVYLTPKVGGDPDEYDTLPGAPKAVGSYIVSVTIEEGLNFTALDEQKLPFNIVKRVLTKNDFAYNFPEEHAFTGVALPLVTATLNASVKGYTKGYKVVILQGNVETELTAMPTAEGKYPIYISVEGDDNFANAMVLLGTYEIHEAGWVGVKGSDRVIPVKPEVKVVTVAPVKVAAAVTFTAGPSPVSKANGKIAFFSSKSVKSGSLYIFDASGNAVAKLSAKSGSGEIASWNLKDKKGSAVAEGSYVVKGALAGKDGTREKVSFVFSVVK